MQIAVLGLGRFGSHLAQELARQGHDVLGVDGDEAVVNGLADQLARAAIADITDLDALRELSIGSMDAVVVATAHLEASVLATMNAQTLQAPQIYAKAQSDRHETILDRLGADRVMRPEHDGAERAAHIIQIANARDYLPLNDDYGIALVEVPARWIGQPLELALDAERTLSSTCLFPGLYLEGKLKDVKLDDFFRPDPAVGLSATMQRLTEEAEALREPNERVIRQIRIWNNVAVACGALSILLMVVGVALLIALW